MLSIREHEFGQIQKYKLAFFSIAIVGYIILAISMYYGVIEPLKEADAELNDTIEAHHKRSKASIELFEAFGYGGFIHNFKNFVLRHDVDALTKAIVKIPVIEQNLKDLRLSNPSDRFQDFYDVVEQVFNQYKSNALWMKDNLDLVLSMSKEELDARVRVDDAPALKAMADILQKNTLLLETAKKQIASEAKIYTFTLQSWGLLASIAYFSLILALYIVYRALYRNYQQLNTISTLSSHAMILTDENGNVVRINPAFRKMFNVPGNVSIKELQVEMFVPTKVKKHKQHRKEYFHSNRQTAMSERTKPFFARRYSGEEFPVKIALSSMSTVSGHLALAMIEDISDEVELKKQAEIDELTQIYNRRYGEHALESEMNRAERYQGYFSLLMIDIDKFKEVNDTLGHDEGDKVLKAVISLIQQIVRKSDTLVRWGGDELVCILPSTDLDHAAMTAGKIVETVANHFKPAQIQTTVSIGVAQMTPNEGTDTLMKKVDSALYQAKQQGRNRFIVDGKTSS
jgi:diguanylate cyclase (GGDEF)-like protein/PAS domain S-box-containing protein